MAQLEENANQSSNEQSLRQAEAEHKIEALKAQNQQLQEAQKAEEGKRRGMQDEEIQSLQAQVGQTIAP